MCTANDSRRRRRRDRPLAAIDIQIPSSITKETAILIIKLIGSDTATSEGLKVTLGQRDPIAPLCRKLIARGHRADELVVIVREGVVVFEPRTLAAWSAWDTVDYDKRGLTKRRWKPFAGVEEAEPELVSQG